MNFTNQNNPNIDFNLNINNIIPPKKTMSSNHVSSNNNNRVSLLKKECKETKILFNTFSAKINMAENKSQKKSNMIINRNNDNNNKIRKINKAKSANYNKIKYYDSEEDKKRDSYLYLVKLKKYYSIQNNNIYNNSKSKYSSLSQSHNIKKIKTKIQNNESNNTNNYLTINNYYINSKLSMTIDSNNKNNNIYNNIIPRNTSHSIFNKKNILNNDISEIINTRKKFNETYNRFYNMEQTLIKKNKKELCRKNNDTSDYSSMNEYWNKRNQDNNKKIVKIKNQLLKKGQREIKSAPKISNKSKELALNSSKNKNDNIKYNNIFDKLFHKKYINNSDINKKKLNSKPRINQKSEKMIRTIDDLFLWNNKRQKKIKEYETKIYKKEIFNKKNINLTSETLLKERRPFYINKKVEDRLIEQGKTIKYKNKKYKEKTLNEMTEQKKYSNRNYNKIKNIKSKYMPKEESKNNESYSSNTKKSNNLFNFNYDYNINIFNKRTALFDKSKSNIIKELNDKTKKNEVLPNTNSKSLLLQNYMKSKVNQNKSNFKIKYNVTDFGSSNYKNEEEKNNMDNIEKLKAGLINNYEKNNFSVNKNMNNNTDRNKKGKNSNIFNIKDKRLEDLKKIIDFSDKLYKNQIKINS